MCLEINININCGVQYSRYALKEGTLVAELPVKYFQFTADVKHKTHLKYCNIFTVNYCTFYSTPLNVFSNMLKNCNLLAAECIYCKYL